MEEIAYLIKDKDFFLMILDYVTKFLEVVQVTINENEIQLKGTDPHDYCYVDATFPSNFFSIESKLGEQTTFNVPVESNFLMDVSILNKILPQLRKTDKVMVTFSEKELIFESTMKKIDTCYRIKWDIIREQIVPKPKKREYSVILDILPNDLITAIQQVYSISNSFSISIDGKFAIFKASQNNFSVETKIQPKFRKRSSIKEITTVSKYMKIISPAIKQSNKVTLYLREGEPPKIELSHSLGGKFVFYFSFKKELAKKYTSSSSLPLIRTDHFMQFIATLRAAQDNTLPIHALTTMKYETKGGDNIRFGKKLELVEKKRGTISLTEFGAEFADELNSSIESAKTIFYNILIENDEIFQFFFDIACNGEPKDKKFLRIQLNYKLKELNIRPIDKGDLSTLIDVGIWCNQIKYENGMISGIS